MDDLILHNPRCSKSRETLELLQEKGVNLTVVEYLQRPPGPKTVLEICKRLGLRPYDLVRRKGKEYDRVVDKLASIGPDDNEGWAQVLASYPILIERPIVLHKGKAALGRPPEKVLEIL